jgi:hypothetical protein
MTDFKQFPNIKFCDNMLSGSRVVSCQRVGHTDIMKLITTFGNSVNTPKQNAMFVTICLMNFYEIQYRSSLQKVVKCDFLENSLCHIVLDSTDGLLRALSRFGDWIA